MRQTTATASCSCSLSWSRWLKGCVARRDLDGRGSGVRADHRFEMPIATILRTVCVVDQFQDRPFDRFEDHFFREPGGENARLCAQRPCTTWNTCPW